MKRIERNIYNSLRKTIAANTICVEIPTEYTHEGRQGIHEMLTIEKHMRASSILWNDIDKCYCIHYVPVVDDYTDEIRKQQEAQDIDEIMNSLPKSDRTWYGFEKPTEDIEDTTKDEEKTITKATEEAPKEEKTVERFEIRQIDAWMYDDEWTQNTAQRTIKKGVIDNGKILH